MCEQEWLGCSIVRRMVEKTKKIRQGFNPKRKYRKKRKKYRSMKVRIIDGRRTVVTYNLREVRSDICFQNIHLSAYAGKEDFLDLACRLRVGQILSVANHVYKKFLLRKWFRLLSEDIKKLVHSRTLTRKFWTEKMLSYVKGMVLNSVPLNEIASSMYDLYYHRIRASTLAKRIFVERWHNPSGPPW